MIANETTGTLSAILWLFGVDPRPVTISGVRTGADGRIWLFVDEWEIEVHATPELLAGGGNGSMTSVLDESELF